MQSNEPTPTNRCIIVDDEILSISSLSYKLKIIDPTIDILATFHDPQIALQSIPSFTFDYLFLDIQMPSLTGFELIEKLEIIDFKIVIVTAHNIETIRIDRNVIHAALHKPVDLSRLRKTLTVVH